jgi:hypothetical protein
MITGGRKGLRGTGSQWLLRSVHVDGSLEAAVEIHGVWSFVFLDLEVTHCPCGLNYTGGGMALTVLDSSFGQFTPGGRAAVITAGSNLMLRNVSSDSTVPYLVDTGKHQLASGPGLSW